MGAQRENRQYLGYLEKALFEQTIDRNRVYVSLRMKVWQGSTNGESRIPKDMIMWEGKYGMLEKVEKWRAEKCKWIQSQDKRVVTCLWIEIVADLKLRKPFVSGSLVYNWTKHSKEQISLL